MAQYSHTLSLSLTYYIGYGRLDTCASKQADLRGRAGRDGPRASPSRPPSVRAEQRHYRKPHIHTATALPLSLSPS